MTHRIDAIEAHCGDQDGVLFIAFRGEARSTGSSLILQCTKDPDEQDRQLGMDQCYLEIEDQARSIYGGITAMTISGSTLCFSLTDEASNALQVEGGVKVELSGACVDLANVTEAIHTLASLQNIPITVD